MTSTKNIIALYQKTYYSLYHDVTIAMEALEQQKAAQAKYMLKDALVRSETILETYVLRKENQSVSDVTDKANSEVKSSY